jgi:hypothetical protein
MDAQFRALGAEFEGAMWNILTSSFGSPIAMDGQLDQDGRVRMLFTPKTTSFSETLLGFVNSCDFYPATGDNVASNEGETFYASVPDSLPVVESWLRQARPTVLHEVKHIVSYAEHLVRNGDLERSWLEEGTAMAAEELYARTFSGAVQRGNTMYATSVRCEYHQDDDPQCAGRPYTMPVHFNALHDYYRNIEGSPVVGGGWTTYGSAWSLVRWTADQSALPETDFFRATTQTVSEYGSANLAARIGRRFDDLFVDWAIASALDDYPGITPAQSVHSLASWNTRDVYLGLYNDPNTPQYPVTFPLTPRSLAFGTFSVTVPSLPVTTASHFEISGTQSATQLVSITDGSGGGLPDDTELRLSVARVK